MKKSGKEEPVVCRIFAETPVQAKPMDPTTSFFDLIGNKPSNMNSSGIVADVGLGHRDISDDGFATRIAGGTEADRRRDAWIPSEKTRQALIASATSPPGTYFPERELLTMPGVVLEEDLTDDVHDTVSRYLGETEAAQCKVLGAGDVTQDERGLRELIQAGYYRSAINLTGRLLTIYGQGAGRSGHPTKHSPHSLQLWFTRIALLIKIKSFTLAQVEGEPFGLLDKPDLFFQFYPEMYGGRPGSIATFSFRLLLAELPMHCGKPKESMIRLFNMVATVRQMITNLKQSLCEDGNPTEINATDRADSLKLWSGREARIQHSIVNCALAQKDFELAIQVLQDLTARPEWGPLHRQALFSALGRIYLQLGDVAGAEKYFAKSREYRSSDSPDVRELVDKGLIAVVQNAFTDAYQCFLQASQLEPTNIMILNNMGVCLLYGGRLKEAIGLLENAINMNPTRGLNESLLINLCNLYDMESSNSKTKKLALLRQIARYKADAPSSVLEKLYS
ncbi:uncharacterized protein CBL_08946 [Carabus blaptoides fortunei]